MTAKQTPLYETHQKYGGKMVEFGGWLLPVQYTGILDEHKTVRAKAGLFDVSHMGEVLVKGPDALAFLQKLVTNDVARIADTQVQYTPMCYPDGGTVDDLLIYRRSQAEYFLVINAANIDKDWQWLQENSAGFQVELTNLSAVTAELALQGPMAETILSKLTDAPLAGLPYYWFIPETIVAGKKVMVSRTGYTGEDGFEIYCHPQEAVDLWEAVMEAGKPYGLMPAGLGCRDTLRFEAALPLYGHELSATITPMEAGLCKFISLDKGEFNGRNVLAQQKQAGLKRKIAGFAVTGRGIPRAEYPVVCEGKTIGSVTTGSYAPTLDKNIGLALMEAGYAKIGQKIAIEIRGKQVPAEVIPKPFYRKGKQS
ncbi:glycine cleavage system aminomethyltransferase GcvT [Sporomusa acidovorans]|uniref:Aminomethyltransferase n=1 Tax=Sporomusa acidovorans (strain ATCC 49682 / DSM 3132 / Mol) TaxID=1123286 RepID=A0ABZ3JA53_SPOA4|nr:glycine cleavage system aminomethyltransferase GcvT [Sporomusa acidovorans]OZC21677.1 aminomethyltransferase [Sporomusa acidovorans DSM 3132]SDD60330.1 aminomethyltransferase [Sporomusa acidovorans]